MASAKTKRRARGRAVPLALVLAGLATPGVAAACGELPPAYVTLTDALPAVRTGLPRDGALVIHAKAWADLGGPTNFATVRLRDQAGNVIPTEDVFWHSDALSVAFHPLVPLPARSTFSFEAAVVDRNAEKPAGADGPLTTSYNFETGDDLAPALALAEPLRVVLEAYDVDVITCENNPPCGATPSSCTKTGTRRTLRARITIPAVTGGIDFDGFRGWLHFTDDHAATFDGPGEARRESRNVNLMT